MYKLGDFDYYALYLPEIDKVVYPSIKFAGSYIKHILPNSYNKFYWWEDFLEFTDEANKKTCTFFNKKIEKKVMGYIPRLNLRQVERPSKEELTKLVWEIPCSSIGKKYNLSDKAIEKWCKCYGITKPPRGYWQKIKSARLAGIEPASSNYS